MVGDKEQDTYIHFTAFTPPLARSTAKDKQNNKRVTRYFLCYLKYYEHRNWNVLFFLWFIQLHLFRQRKNTNQTWGFVLICMIKCELRKCSFPEKTPAPCFPDLCALPFCYMQNCWGCCWSNICFFPSREVCLRSVYIFTSWTLKLCL